LYASITSHMRAVRSYFQYTLQNANNFSIAINCEDCRLPE